jgi:phage-related protein
MGRAAQNATMNASNQERANIDALNQQFLNQSSQLQNILTPQYQSILNNPGYTPQQQAAITGQSLGALSSAFGSLQQAAQNRAARTRNAAGFGELADELAREKGREAASTTQQNQIAFANNAQQQQMAALQGLSGLYGTNTSLLSRTLGIPAQLLSVNANLAKGGNGFLSSLGSTLGGMLGGLAGGFF